MPLPLNAWRRTELVLPIASSFFLFLAWLLLLLVSVSIPITKSIYFFQLSASASSSLLDSHASGAVRVGVWGYCITGEDVDIVGIDHQAATECSAARLGYNLDTTVARALHVDSLASVVSETLSATLVLHVISCILTFLALVLSLFMLKAPNIISHVRRRVRWSTVTLIVTGVAAALTSLIFFIDIALVVTARNKINGDLDGVLHFILGNALWLTLVADIFLLAACISVLFYRSKSARAGGSFDSNLMVSESKQQLPYH